jgi:predicted secreted protein
MSSRTLLSAFRPLTFTARRTFTTTRTLRIKEDANRTPEQLEQAKQEQLKEQEQGKGRWREDLASHGESNIAADKEKVHDHESHMKDLQKETAKKGEKGEL